VPTASQISFRDLLTSKTAVCWSLALLLCFAGCGTAVVQSLREVAKLRAQLIEEFHENDIQVSIGNSTQLTVTFVNSELNQSGPEARARRAKDTALFIKSHYPNVQRLERIWILFATYETRYIVVHYSRSVDMFVFDRNAARIEMGYGSPPSESHADDEARATYKPARIKLTCKSLGCNFPATWTKEWRWCRASS